MCRRASKITISIRSPNNLSTQSLEEFSIRRSQRIRKSRHNPSNNKRRPQLLSPQSTTRKQSRQSKRVLKMKTLSKTLESLIVVDRTIFSENIKESERHLRKRTLTLRIICIPLSLQLDVSPLKSLKTISSSVASVKMRQLSQFPRKSALTSLTSQSSEQRTISTVLVVSLRTSPSVTRPIRARISSQ